MIKTLAVNWFPTGYSLSDNQKPEDIVKTVIELFFSVVAIAAVIMIIWAGFKYITSAGDTSKAQEAQKQIVYAVIGLLIAIVAYTLTELVWTKFTNQNSLPNLEIEKVNDATSTTKGGDQE